jgi:tetratricopeptide (TPR) repeat protein
MRVFVEPFESRIVSGQPMLNALSKLSCLIALVSLVIAWVNGPVRADHAYVPGRGAEPKIAERTAAKSDWKAGARTAANADAKVGVSIDTKADRQSDLQAGATDASKAALMKAYKGGDFKAAEAFGEEAIKLQPQDGEARYYLANAQMKLGKNDEAIKNYRLCRSVDNHEQIRKYAGQALDHLLGEKEKLLTNLASSRRNLAQQDEMSQFERRLKREQIEEEERLEQQYNQDRNNLMRGLGRRSYGWAFSNALRNLDEQYDRKVGELHEHTKAILSQTNCGTSNIRVVPSLSSSKVKNYINYSDQAQGESIPTENPLRANALSMPDGTQKKQQRDAKQQKERRAQLK